MSMSRPYWLAREVLDGFFGPVRSANTVFAGPTAGASAIPNFRALVAADLPALPGGTVTEVDTAGLATGGPITTIGTVSVTAAAKSDQQSGSSNALAVTPLHQQDHDSAAKAWVEFNNAAGVITIEASYNVASVVHTGTGDITINFTTPFATANYVCIPSIGGPVNGGLNVGTSVKAQLAGSVEVNCFTGGTALDRGMSVICFGRQ